MIDINIWNKWINSKQLTELQKNTLNSIFNFIFANFKELKLAIKWNQPMFEYNNSFIIGLSCLKEHISISPERYVIDIYKDKIVSSNYVCTNNLFKLKYTDNINFDLLKQIIEFQLKNKLNASTYFKK